MNIGKRYGIELSKPCDYPYKSILIDPYLLGIWIGDGTSSEGGLTSNDPEIINEIRNRGYTVNKRKSKYGYGVLGLKDDLRNYNLLDNKHIPTDYLFNCIENRIQLLQGLMDSDGYTDDRDWET